MRIQVTWHEAEEKDGGACGLGSVRHPEAALRQQGRIRAPVATRLFIFKCTSGIPCRNGFSFGLRFVMLFLDNVPLRNSTQLCCRMYQLLSTEF